MIRKIIPQYLFYRRSQYQSRERLEAYQDERLRRLIRHAGRFVPYYRKLFREIGLDAEKFQGHSDLAKIPLLDKEIVRTRFRELIADNAAKYGGVWDSTSGSTGTPLHFLVDQGARVNKLCALIRSYQWAGYSLGKKTFSLQSYYLRNRNWEFKKLYRVLRFDSNQLKRESAAEVIPVLRRWKPRFYMGFPFDLQMLARFALQAGLTLPSPDSMVTYGETLSAARREALQEAYGCPVFDFYSQHECVSMIAECEHHSLHLVEDFAYHEIVAADGSDATERLRGELVGTGYYNFAMPLIRYRTRDEIILEQEGEHCACGRVFRRVREIIGKQCDYIETPDGRVLGAVMSHAMDRGQGVVLSQCVQDAPDHIYVNLITDESFRDESLRALEEDLRKRLGGKMKIEFRLVSQLEKRPGGKTPFLLSKIGNQYA
jgi:phenylacetate-CoA ligase